MGLNIGDKVRVTVPDYIITDMDRETARHVLRYNVKIVTIADDLDDGFYSIEEDNGYMAWEGEWLYLEQSNTEKTENKIGRNIIMKNLNEMVKTGMNGETLVKGKDGGFYMIGENGTPKRTLTVFENIAPIQQMQVETLTERDIIIHENALWYVSAVSETEMKITNYETLTSVNMAVMQADGLGGGFTKVVNPITFQINKLNVKARDLLATVDANIPKLRVAMEFANSDNLSRLADVMLGFIESQKNK